MLIRNKSSSKVEISEDSVNALIRAIKNVREFFEKRKARDLEKPQEMYVSNLPGEALEMFWFCNEIVQGRTSC